MTKELTIAYVLHSRPFKETSLLVNLFSKEQGRFSLVAKGIKRKNNQALKAILQPFNLLNIEYSGRSELKTLCEASLSPDISSFDSINRRAIACGYYLNELLMRSTQEWQESPQLFGAYHQCIDALRGAESFAAILRRFEVALLTELGVAPDWQIDTSGEVIQTDQRYHFINEQGFELISARSGSEPTEFNKTVSINPSLGYSGDAILSLGSGQFSEELNRSCQQITQMLLRLIIGNKPLESRKLWL